MLNPFYRIENVEDGLAVWNIYRNEPVLKVTGKSVKFLHQAAEYQDVTEANTELKRKLSQRGIFLDAKRASMYKKLLMWTEEFESVIDRYKSSEVIIRCLQQTDIRMLASAGQSIFEKTGLTAFSGNTNATYIHYLVFYDSKEALQRLVKLIDRRYCSTLFLCKTNENEILEIGPCYPITASFCFDCLIDNLDRYRVIYTRVNECLPAEMLENEYLKAIMDYYTLFMTTLAQTHERKILIEYGSCSSTTVIPPRSPRCTCYIESQSGSFADT
ncbi:hypothetical protein ACM1RC_08900 [Paenibacillus azoreducens]|uniref:hypothetical protein n=1 Tax=Paenibacillus azoreducens TaxID=116718 RepID=UPI0039F6345D